MCTGVATVTASVVFRRMERCLSRCWHRWVWSGSWSAGEEQLWGDLSADLRYVKHFMGSELSCAVAGAPVFILFSFEPACNNNLCLQWSHISQTTIYFFKCRTLFLMFYICMFSACTANRFNTQWRRNWRMQMNTWFQVWISKAQSKNKNWANLICELWLTKYFYSHHKTLHSHETYTEKRLCFAFHIHLWFGQSKTLIKEWNYSVSTGFLWPLQMADSICRSTSPVSACSVQPGLTKCRMNYTLVS